MKYHLRLNNLITWYVINNAVVRDISKLSDLYIKQKGHQLNTFEVLGIAKAKKTGKALINEKLEFNVSPLSKLVSY